MGSDGRAKGRTHLAEHHFHSHLLPPTQLLPSTHGNKPTPAGKIPTCDISFPPLQLDFPFCTSPATPFLPPLLHPLLRSCPATSSPQIHPATQGAQKLWFYITDICPYTLTFNLSPPLHHSLPPHYLGQEGKTEFGVFYLCLCKELVLLSTWSLSTWV